ncbi:hypothetical protein DFH08DRAFT_823497 [Mycena albidolilacea]|uniref:Uncharacterized protein n=1 Tax=Mycena albidolilacea TaxID=1033008 RepID=A0AAD7EC04_9AGAR|nr:hypothetical protein DFH08DRAFT_823497 [Mycena albidolilacea]
MAKRPKYAEIADALDHDPTIKDQYFFGQMGERELLKFDQYHAASPSNTNSPTPAVEISQESAHQCHGSSFLLDAIKSGQKSQHGVGQPRDELKQYLSTQLKITDNILHWWGGFSTPAERAFSSGTLTGTQVHNRLSAKFLEFLQLLKSGYRNGHNSAGESAANWMEAFITQLHE